MQTRLSDSPKKVFSWILLFFPYSLFDSLAQAKTSAAVDLTYRFTGFCLCSEKNSYKQIIIYRTSLNLTLYLGETEYGLQTIDLATMTAI